jgi:hypothetical protein
MLTDRVFFLARITAEGRLVGLKGCLSRVEVCTNLRGRRRAGGGRFNLRMLEQYTYQPTEAV